MPMRAVVEAQICVTTTLQLHYRSAHTVRAASTPVRDGIVLISFGRAKVSLSIIDVTLQELYKRRLLTKLLSKNCYKTWII